MAVRFRPSFRNILREMEILAFRLEKLTSRREILKKPVLLIEVFSAAVLAPPPESMRKAISRRNSSSGNSLRQQGNTLRISSLFHAAEIREPQPGTASARNREWPRRRRHVPERQADPFRCRSPAYSKLQTPHPLKTPYLLSTLILHAPALLARHAETALPSHTIRIPMYAKPYLANPTPPLHRIDQFRPIFHT